MSLQQTLGQISQRVHSLIPPEKLAVSERAVAELESSGLAQRALSAGSKAPLFELPDAAGKLVRSQDLLALGKLILIFFRGRWCPYCVAQLESWQILLPQVKQVGALVVAVSPQTVRQTAFMVEQHKLAFPLLCDAGNQLARDFGLVYRVPDYLEEQYRHTMINLPNSNGDQSWELPLAATYVLAHNGTILFAQVDADHRVRPEPVNVISVAGA